MLDRIICSSKDAPRLFSGKSSSSDKILHQKKLNIFNIYIYLNMLAGFLNAKKEMDISTRKVDFPASYVR